MGLKIYLSEDAGGIAVLTHVLENTDFRDFLLAHPSFLSLNKNPVSQPTCLTFPKTFHSAAQFTHVPKYPTILSYFPGISTSLDSTSTMPLQGTFLCAFRTWLNGVLQLPGVLLRGSKGIRYVEFTCTFYYIHIPFV